VRRSQSAINREIVEAVFALPTPANDGVERAELNLANGTFVVAELSNVVEGDFEALSEAERDAMRASVVRDGGSNELRAFVANLRESGSVVINESVADEGEF
jgi:hypothetical protein